MGSAVGLTRSFNPILYSMICYMHMRPADTPDTPRCARVQEYAAMHILLFFECRFEILRIRIEGQFRQ